MQPQERAILDLHTGARHRMIAAVVLGALALASPLTPLDTGVQMGVGAVLMTMAVVAGIASRSAITRARALASGALKKAAPVVPASSATADPKASEDSFAPFLYGMLMVFIVSAAIFGVVQLQGAVNLSAESPRVLELR